MPFLVALSGRHQAGHGQRDMVLNLDFARDVPRFRRRQGAAGHAGPQLPSDPGRARRRGTGDSRCTTATGCTWPTTASRRITASARSSAS